jgi:hypothetical protein
MRIMFNMINESRMAVAFQGLTCSSAAYLMAVNYARERIQGRDLKDFSDAGAPSVPIIKHPDVRRNLLWMKSYVEAMRSFYYYMVVCSTKEILSQNEAEKEYYGEVFSMLTPIVKDYLAVKGYDVCVQGIQVHGGVGYCKDYLAEQYARDCKIASIYEGTSGIQAMDLLARKIGLKKGAVFMNFLSEIQKTVAQAKETDGLSDLAVSLESAVNKLGEMTMDIGKKAMSEEFKVAFAHSLPYLYAMGDTIMAWMLLWRAVVASQKLAGKPKNKDVNFYEGQLKSAEFFIKTELPVALGKMDAIQSGCPAAIEIDDAGFGGL